MRAWLGAALLLSACGAGTTPAAAPPSSATPPLRAAFVTLGRASPAPPPAAPCETSFVAVVRGKATALGEDLAPGDVLVARGGSALDLTGDGEALVASTVGAACPPDSQRGEPSTQVVRAGAAPALTWANGAMHARLDVEKELSPAAYFGRLEGTAGVAEHAHDASWEILCAVEAAGTFTLDGRAARLGADQCVFVPPGAKHSWSPDPGSKLTAFQMYAPPGPEQRFKKLAADAAPTK